MFIQNKDDVYRDMIIGVHQRPGDLHVRLSLLLFAAAVRCCCLAVATLCSIVQQQA
jgi:predicted membrane GTPase involved in stress response